MSMEITSIRGRVKVGSMVYFTDRNLSTYRDNYGVVLRIKDDGVLALWRTTPKRAGAAWDKYKRSLKNYKTPQVQPPYWKSLASVRHMWTYNNSCLWGRELY